MSFLPADLKAAMIAAAPGGRVRARLSFLVEQINPNADPIPFPVDELRAGALVAKLGCPDCTELVAVADDAMESDWEPVPEEPAPEA